MTKNRAASWSFSKLLVHDSCPLRYKLQHLDRVPDLQPKTAADRGTAIHQEAEDYVRGIGPFTNNLRHFKADLGALAEHYREGRVVCEGEWGYTRDWAVGDWSTAWLRLKCDAVCFLNPTHAVVIDYKTGARFGNEIKHARQLQLYAVCALIRFPDIEKVTCELFYFDQNELASFEMKRSQLKKYLTQFDKDGRGITEAKDFPPRPSIIACKYCSYAPHKQGDCKFGVDPSKPFEKKVEFSKITKPLNKKTASLLERLG